MITNGAGCQSGYYRRNCSHRCSENYIVTSQCDRFTGRCGGGCKQGWTGNTCDERMIIFNLLKQKLNQVSVRTKNVFKKSK